MSAGSVTPSCKVLAAYAWDDLAASFDARVSCASDTPPLWQHPLLGYVQVLGHFRRAQAEEEDE